MASFTAALNIRPLLMRFSGESLTKKAFLNTLGDALEYGARLAVGFVITPLLVAALGDFVFGAWQILRRLTEYLAAAAGRSSQALKWTIARSQASTKYEEKRQSVGSALAVWLLFLPLLAMLGGLLAWMAPSLVGAPMDFSWRLRMTAVLLVANIVVISLVKVPRSVLRGENLGYKPLGLSAILVFVGAGFTAIALHLEAGLVGLAAAYLATTLLSGVFALRVVRTHVPWFGVAIPSLANIRGFIGLSGWFLAWRLVSEILQTGDVVQLGLMTSTEMVTTYSLTRYSSETMIRLIGLAAFSVLPGLAGIIGSGDWHKAIQVRNEIMLITWVAATPIGITILLWNRAFLGLWVGAEYYAGSIPTLLLVLMAMQFVLIRNDGNVIDLTLNLRRKVLMGILSVFVSVILAGILVSAFNLGIIGLGLGFFAGRSILSLAYPWLVGRLLGVTLFSQLKSVLRPAFTTLLLLVLALGVGKFLNASTWFGFVVSAGVTLGVVSFLAFYTGLSGDRRRRILRRAAMVARPAVAS